MNLQADVLADLPDVAFYHLLISADPSEVLRLRQVLGAKRPGVFQQAEKFFREKYGLRDLPLLVIDRILALEDKDDSMYEALKHGDYPQYAVSVYEKLDNPIGIIDYSLLLGRIKSAIAMLELVPSEDLWELIRSASEHQCESCLLYIFSRVDFNDALLRALQLMYEPPINVEWVLRVADPEVDVKLVTFLMKSESESDFLKLLVPKMSDEELVKGRREVNGNNYHSVQQRLRIFDEEIERRKL